MQNLHHGCLFEILSPLSHLPRCNHGWVGEARSSSLDGSAGNRVLRLPGLAVDPCPPSVPDSGCLCHWDS